MYRSVRKNLVTIMKRKKISANNLVMTVIWKDFRNKIDYLQNNLSYLG